jgi:signal recognition particle subunit SRP54
LVAENTFELMNYLQDLRQQGKLQAPKQSLSDKFEAIFKKLRGEARVREAHIEETLREVRLALLEADVNLQVVKDFTEAIRRQALGQDVLQSLTPAQQIIKIVHQELVTLMGEAGRGLDLSAAPPVPVMLVGLQGSGKTTTVGKLARYLKLERNRNPYLVPADVQRPAAIEQLRLLGEQVGCAVHPSTSDQNPVAICRAALTVASYNVRINLPGLTDSAQAGRLGAEAEEILSRAEPIARQTAQRVREGTDRSKG